MIKKPFYCWWIGNLLGIHGLRRSIGWPLAVVIIHISHPTRTNSCSWRLLYHRSTMSTAKNLPNRQPFKLIGRETILQAGNRKSTKSISYYSSLAVLILLKVPGSWTKILKASWGAEKLISGFAPSEIKTLAPSDKAPIVPFICVAGTYQK